MGAEVRKHGLTIGPWFLIGKELMSLHNKSLDMGKITPTG